MSQGGKEAVPAGGHRGRSDGRELASPYGIPPNQVFAWKKQPLDGAAGVFRAGGTEDTASTAQIDLL